MLVHFYAERMLFMRYCFREALKSIKGILVHFVIKFRYNARSDWLKQRALSEYRCTE